MSNKNSIFGPLHFFSMFGIDIMPKQRIRTTLNVDKRTNLNNICIGCGHKNKKCTCNKE